MPLNRAWIEAHIPHAGSMCLLDAVLGWDATTLRAVSGTHRRQDHPLAVDGVLGIACGIEYAAQAMAVHGALAADAVAPAAGFLAALRGVRFHAGRLDDIAADLVCDITQLAGDPGSALYEFRISAAEAPLLEGRATVIFNASAWTKA